MPPSENQRKVAEDRTESLYLLKIGMDTGSFSCHDDRVTMLHADHQILTHASSGMNGLILETNASKQESIAIRP